MIGANRSAMALAALLLATPLAAQEKTPLTLDEARTVALANNPSYRQAQNDVTSARAGELIARSAFLPSLNASFGSNASTSRRRTGMDDFDRPIEGDNIQEYTGSGSNQGLSLNLQLFDGGGRWRDAKAASAGRAASVAGVDVAAATLEAELTRRYYEAQRAAAIIALEEALLAAAESRHEATQRLIRVAAASPVDLLGAEYEVSRQRQALESARGDARIALLSLAEQMGTGEAADWQLVTDIPEVFDPATLDPASLVGRAYEVSPRLRQLGLQAEQADQQRRAAGAARWPTIGLGANFGRSINRQGYDALFEPNPFDQNLGFSVNVSLPIFNQYQTSQRVTQARVAAANADEAARQTRLQIDREVRTALIELEKAYSAVVLNEASTDLARRRLEMGTEQYRLGALNFAAMQDIIDAAANAEREALNARYAFAAALVTLRERVGGDF